VLKEIILEQMKIKRNVDLYFINALSALFVLITIFLHEPILQFILGIPFILLFPGFTLMSALYPRIEDLDSSERLVLSLGLSFTIVPLIGLALNYTPFGISPTPTITLLFLFILLMSILSAYKRSKISAEDYSPSFSPIFNNKKTAMVGLFLIAVCLLILYLESIRRHIYLPSILFWIVIFFILSIVVYQILQIKLFPSYDKVVLLEIIVVCTTFHLIYQIPYYGLIGYDTYMDLTASKSILFSGFIMGDPRYINAASYFPVIHIFGVMFSFITNLNIFHIAKWVPSFIDGAALIPLLYLLILKIFKDRRIGLLSALLFASIQEHILFSSLFVRQTYALILAVLCIYLYFSSGTSTHPIVSRILSTICLVLAVLAHHLTSFMISMFILIHFLSTKTLKIPFFKRTYFKNIIVEKEISFAFILMAFIAELAYWIYVVLSPFYTLVSFARSLLVPEEWWINTYVELAGIRPTSFPTIRGYIIFYGFYLFHFTFAFILLCRLMLKPRKLNMETWSFTLFFYLCLLLGFLSAYVVNPAASPQRFLPFGWLFGSAPLTATILRDKHKWFKRIGVFLLITFILFNIYMIEPTAWDAQAEGIPSAASEEDFALANAIDFSNGRIFGPNNPLMAIYALHNNLGTIFAHPYLSEFNLVNFDYIIIQKKQLELEKKYNPDPRTETIATLRALVNGTHMGYNKIYESGNILVFQPSQQIYHNNGKINE